MGAALVAAGAALMCEAAACGFATTCHAHCCGCRSGPLHAAPPCRSIGLLLAEPQGRQFFSSLEPLSAEQRQRVKAAATAAASGAGGGKKARVSGTSKAAAAAAAAAAGAAPGASSGAPPAAAGSGGSAGGSGGALVVALCVLPIHLSQSGQGRPAETLYLVPLRAGTWGGMLVKEQVAEQGRSLAAQLLHSELTIVAFGMQGAWERGVGGRRCACAATGVMKVA